jgi:RHS repeat-associated protein
MPAATQVVPVDVIAKSPVSPSEIVTREIVRFALPVFETVTDSTPLALPTIWLPKATYDSAVVDGQTMQYAKGHLANAYTGNSNSRTTDLGFSYNARGDSSDVYEATPNSSGYYHLNQTYWANEVPDQLSGLSGLPTLVNALDGEGRVSQVTATEGMNPVTAVTYNSASLATRISLGSGDSDSFGYDPHTMRMTQYNFTVGTTPQTMTGNLTWNANGTLQQLAIADPFNSSDAQTCNYSHDDLIRVATANCGGAAAQTFSYDPFGNIDYSGSPYSFQPTYSATTNRMTSLGGYAPTYDANGNLTDDSVNAYSWDANGEAITVNGVDLTYDALGRMVEQNRSGVTTQVVYGPSGGKLALMSGQGIGKAFIGLPGQGAAVYTSGGLDHFRHSDWLGSARLTSSTSQTVLFTGAYAPFGDPYAQSGTPDTSFTGQNQDTSSGIYDFPAREYNSESRWVSPDPSGLLYADPAHPQSLNLYGYGANNPLVNIDPTGLALQVNCIDDPDTVTISTDDNGNSTTTVTAGAQNCVIWDDGTGEYSGMLPSRTFATFTPPNLAPNNPCSENGPNIVRDASVNALSRLNPGQDESTNITPRDGNFANVLNPSLINTTSWANAASAHGSSLQSPTIPGQSTFVVKLYSDPQRGNIIAVVYPNGTLQHLGGLIPFLAGSTNVNVPAARAYMGCHD